MKHVLRLLALMAALWLAAAGAREPDPGRRGRENESGERERVERYQAAYKALHELIADGSKLQAAYLETDDLAALQQAGAAWEARAIKFLRRNMPPLYAEEFAGAIYQGPDLPVGKDPQGRAAWQRIEARKARLRAYLTELWKPD